MEDRKTEDPISKCGKWSLVKETQKTDFSIKMAYKGRSRSRILGSSESRDGIGLAYTSMLALAVKVPKIWRPK